MTSFTGFTLGDVLAQNFIEESDQPYDMMRTARLGSFGLLLHGPVGHYFYGLARGSTMEETLLAVKKAAAAHLPPFGYFLIDSFWYALPLLSAIPIPAPTPSVPLYC